MLERRGSVRLTEVHNGNRAHAGVRIPRLPAVSRPSLRMPRDISAAARWTAARPRGWRYWLATAVVIVAGWVVMEWWAATAGLLVACVGLWLCDRFVAPPDLDAEPPRRERRRTPTPNAR